MKILGTDFLGSVPWAQIKSSSQTHCSINLTKVNRNTPSPLELIASSSNSVNMPVSLRGNLVSFTHFAQETNTVLITSA